MMTTKSNIFLSERDRECDIGHLINGLPIAVCRQIDSEVALVPAAVDQHSIVLIRRRRIQLH